MHVSKRNSEKNEEKLLTTEIYRDFGMNYEHDKEKKMWWSFRHDNLYSENAGNVWVLHV